MHAVTRELDEAARRLIQETPGGARALARQMGYTPGTLHNKVNPNQPHQLSVADAVALQRLSGRIDILQTEAALLNCVVVHMGEPEGASDVELLTLYAGWSAEDGHTHAAIRHALEDGRVTAAEVSQVKAEYFEAAGAGLEFVQRLGGLVDA